MLAQYATIHTEFTYIRTHVRVYIHTYIHTYVLTYLIPQHTSCTYMKHLVMQFIAIYITNHTVGQHQSRVRLLNFK